MSDLQRWKAVQWDKSQWIESLAMPTDDGPYVTYNDHVAAVGAERENTRIRQGKSYINGYNSALDALARDLLTDAPYYIKAEEVRTAINALRGGQS